MDASFFHSSNLDYERDSTVVLAVRQSSCSRGKVRPEQGSRPMFKFAQLAMLAKKLVGSFVVKPLTRKKTVTHLRKIEIRYRKKLMILIIHIILLLLATLVVRHLVKPEITLFIICSVYVSSVLYTWYNILKVLPKFLILVTVYRCNVREMIHGEILLKTGVPKWILGWYKEQIVTSAVDSMIDHAPRIILVMVACFLLYNTISPFIVRWAADMNLIRAVLYPFLFSIDYLSRIELSNKLEGFSIEMGSMMDSLSSMISRFLGFVSSIATKVWTGLRAQIDRLFPIR